MDTTKLLKIIEKLLFYPTLYEVGNFSTITSIHAKLQFLTIYLKTYLGINGLVFENEGWLLQCDFFDGFYERVFAIEEIEINTYHVVDISATLNLDAASLSVFKGVSS